VIEVPVGADRAGVGPAGAGGAPWSPPAIRSTPRRASEGRRGLFEIYKMRTMVHGAEFAAGPRDPGRANDRDHPLGRLPAPITRLDELPNLYGTACAARCRKKKSSSAAEAAGPGDQYTMRERGRIA